jgi:hypothetical protein
MSESNIKCKKTVEMYVFFAFSTLHLEFQLVQTDCSLMFMVLKTAYLYHFARFTHTLLTM